MNLSDVDLNNLDTFERALPHDQWKILREEAPLFRHPGAPGEEDYGCVTKYDDLKLLSKSPMEYSSEARAAMPRPEYMEHCMESAANGYSGFDLT